jgi:hypothetical protein
LTAAGKDRCALAYVHLREDATRYAAAPQLPLPPPPSGEAGTLADANSKSLNPTLSKDPEIVGLRAALERISRWERYGGEDSKPLVYPVDIAKQALAALREA